MAHGYGKGDKYRGGSQEKRNERKEPRESSHQDSRKTHDTKKTEKGNK